MLPYTSPSYAPPELTLHQGARSSAFFIVAALGWFLSRPMLDTSSAAVAQASTEIVIGSAPYFWNANPSHKPPGCSDFYEAAVGDLLVFKYGHEKNVWQLADEAAWEACSWAGATQLAGETEGGASSADSAKGIVNKWSAVTTAPGVLHFAVAYYSSGDQREFCQDGQKIRVRVSDGHAPECPPSLPPLPLSPPSPPPPAIPGGGGVGVGVGVGGGDGGGGGGGGGVGVKSACATYVKNESLWVASSASGHSKCYGVQGAKNMIACRNHCGYTACEHAPGVYCSTGGSTVTIDSAAENEFVLSLVGKLSAGEASLGGMQLAARSRPTYTNWASGQPVLAASGTSCAVIQKNGLWVSRACSEMAVCLCQFKLPSPPPSPPFSPSPASPPLPPPDSGDAALSDVVLPVAIAVGSVSAVLAAAIISVGVLRRRRRDNLLSATPSGHAERAVRESHPVIAPDGDVSLATKTAA